METKPVFTWADFENSKIAVRYEGQPLARIFLNMCEARGFVWDDGNKKISEYDFDTYGVFMCLNGDKRLNISIPNTLSMKPIIDLTDILTIKESESESEPKYRPFTKLKPDLLGKTVYHNRHDYEAYSTITENVRIGDMFSVVIKGSHISYDELFEDYEFYDPKTGATSPCGEVDCE